MTYNVFAYRTTQSLISATVHATDKHLRVETLGAVSFFPKILNFIPKCQKMYLLLIIFSHYFNLLELTLFFILSENYCFFPVCVCVSICCFVAVCLWQIYPLLAKKIASLAENTSAKTVFDEVLATAGRDTVTKDISRLRGGWPMQDAFYVSLF